VRFSLRAGNFARPESARARVERQPKYLTLYEFEHARVPESEAWTRARASNPWTRRMQPNLRHDDGSPGVYQRIYPK
jgi:hypothetical protein